VFSHAANDRARSASDGRRIGITQFCSPVMNSRHSRSTVRFRSRAPTTAPTGPATTHDPGQRSAIPHLPHRVHVCVHTSKVLAPPIADRAITLLLHTELAHAHRSRTARTPVTNHPRRVRASQRPAGIQLARDGLSNREIAQTLFATTKTVETHLGAAYRKLGVARRTELAAALP
jgi:hypothetical protein